VKLRSRDLNRLVSIERVTATDNQAGGQTEVWAEIGRAYVKATPIAGKEALVAGILQTQQPWRVEMRFRADLTTLDRFAASWLPAGFRLTLESVTDPDGSRDRLLILGTAAMAF